VTDAAGKRAALALHGLAEKDREWVLSQLAASDVETLSGHLDELEELGFPGEVPDLVDEAIAGDRPLHITAEVRNIDAAAPKLVHRVLKDEQASTLALIMGDHPWRWRKQVMRLLGRAKRSAVQEAIAQRGNPVSDAVRTGVIKSLADALEVAASRNVPASNFDWRGMFR